MIPIYQRNYSWTREECSQLWDDVLRTGRDASIPSHFIGSIVYVERGLSTVSSREAMLVIDGQQRLTTVTLLLIALAEHLDKQGPAELLESFSAKKIRNYYLVNPEETGERHYKLLLSTTDRDTMLSIIGRSPIPANGSRRIIENLKYLRDKLEHDSSELEAICRGIDKLVIVDVSLDRTHDNPQLIFESMNSTGRELSQADLIRNFILMGQEPARQNDLYKNFWYPMETGFGQAAYALHFDPFMRHYLTAKTGTVPNIQGVYAAFKLYAAGKDIPALVEDIHKFAQYYCAMALGAETDPQCKMAFQDLKELKVDVVYPFLLELYDDWQAGLVNKEDFEKIVRLVESYIFRRAVCDIPTNSLNKTFPGLSKLLDKNAYLESVEATFAQMPSYRRFPADAEFKKMFIERDLYNLRSRSYWLRKLENHERRERVIVEELTIEHIMPQNEALSSEWRDELGEDWKRVHETYLHTLGNLTLTAYNSELSDSPFLHKLSGAKDRNGNCIGLSKSPLKLNAEFTTVEVWNEEKIKARAERLSTEALNVWRAPQPLHNVENKSRPKIRRASQQFGVEDYPNLARTSMRRLFDLFRTAVLNLDPCITEEFTKNYVAYKAETNFVDVKPQSKRLSLAINMRFGDVKDPNQRCRDVTGIGHWGNGDIEIGLSSEDELLYVMGIVRQSFDQQMGGTDEYFANQEDESELLIGSD